jgi:hypothetical protein
LAQIIKNVLNHGRNILQWPSLKTSFRLVLKGIYRIKGKYASTVENL